MAVFAVTVSPVTVEQAHRVVPLPVIVIVDAPIVSVRVFEFDDENSPHEHV